jgi:alpha-glucosidase
MECTRRTLLRGLTGSGAVGLVALSETAESDVARGPLHSDVLSRDISLGAFVLRWRNPDAGNASLVVHHDPTDQTIWRSRSGENFLAAAETRLNVHESRGSFDITETIVRARGHQTVAAVTATEGQATVSGTLSKRGSDGVRYRLRFSVPRAGHLRFDVDVDIDRLALRYASTTDERFHGFGEQYNYLDLKGREVPVITEEQGIGRNHVVISTLVESVASGASGTTLSTYAPMPYYLSNKGYSFALENTAYSVFDLTDEEVTTVRCYDRTMTGRLIAGATPMDRVERFTEYTGRMPALPDWLHRIIKADAPRSRNSASCWIREIFDFS